MQVGHLFDDGADKFPRWAWQFDQSWRRAAHRDVHQAGKGCHFAGYLEGLIVGSHSPDVNVLQVVQVEDHFRPQ